MKQLRLGFPHKHLEKPTLLTAFTRVDKKWVPPETYNAQIPLSPKAYWRGRGMLQVNKKKQRIKDKRIEG